MPDRFCGRCGQERKTLRVAFHRIVGEGIAESLSLDSRISRTLAMLVLRPGQATRAYLDGKRASQTSPIKVYLLLSFLFFFIGAFRPGGGLEFKMEDGTAEDPAIVSSEGLRELREAGGLGARVADRVEAISALPAGEVRRAVNAGFTENVPKAMFFLVPLLALLLRLFYLRSGYYFAEHVVLALHAHAVAFLFLLPGAISGWSGLTSAGLVAAGAHTASAMHRVYGRGWPGTLARAAVIAWLYLMALGVVLVAVVVAAFMAM